MKRIWRIPESTRDHPRKSTVSSIGYQGVQKKSHSIIVINIRQFIFLLRRYYKMLHKNLLDIIADYLHCDLVPTPSGIELQLRHCQYFEIVTHNGRTMVFPCHTQ